MEKQIDLGGFDPDNLPPFPWTREALGQEQFKKLAEACGAGYAHAQRNPSIDPHSFAMGCANMQISREGLDLPQAETEKDDDWKVRTEKAKAIRAEAVEIQPKINAALPVGAGSPRDQSVGKLTPAKTTVPASMREQGFVREK